ncbi:hypothetical protein ES703_08352 [subsurface metagenome]
MTSFTQRTARHFVVIKAARQLRGELEKAGLDNLRAIADAGKSIIGIYLKGCSPEEKKRFRRDTNILVKLGVTPEMVLDAVIGQSEVLTSIMEKRADYKKSELRNLEAFLKES